MMGIDVNRVIYYIMFVKKYTGSDLNSEYCQIYPKQKAIQWDT